jgi:hypothetical protein
MLDIDLFVAKLRNNGHTVAHVIPLPENAGEYEFEIDGGLLTLAEARLLLEQEQPA